ncbi:uncharacterized protein PAE49_022072 [Odontesthes bonariensis]|uniref:uncharacterized protein LOC142369975 n=1 Tax=Odontesthes bonariensis TaxID=219752 RepID=UPI003F58B199
MEGELFHISSSLILSDSDTGLDYTCTISTRRNQKRTTLFKSTNISGSGAEIQIPCKAPKSPIKNITWRFNRGQIILTKSEAESYNASDEWKKHVKEVLETGLTLKDLSSNQEGEYMCEISNTEDTYIHTSNFFLQKKEGNFLKEERNNAAIAAGVTIGLVAVGVLIAVLLWRKKYSNKAKHSPVPTQDSSIPTQDSPVPTQDSSIPTQDSSIPTQDSSIPTQDSSVPTQDSSVPTQDSSVPTQDSPVPTQDSSVPTQDSSVPTQDSSVPTQDSSVPTQDSSVPTQDSPVPTQDSSVPTQDSPSL